MQSQNTSVLGDGRGIDHLVVAVRDLEAAKDTYRDRLGFNLPHRGQIRIHPTGTKNSSTFFDNETYLELIAINDREKAAKNNPRLVSFLDTQEGAIFLGLNTSSAEHTANLLRSRGIAVTDPQPGTILVKGAKEIPSPKWWIVSLKQPALPADPIFFIEYDHNAWEDHTREIAAAEASKQPNTAKGIRSVWIAVQKLESATKNYKSVGFPAGEQRHLALHGAIACAINLKGGTILLLEPTDKSGTVASFLNECGEGIMGVSIEVSNLEAARNLLEAKAERKFTAYPGADGESILVPAGGAHGVWIEMFQKP